jgi:hypothetical protein
MPYIAVGDYDGNVHVVSQAQLDKRTHFQPGETYRLGECIVTVHASKADMLAAIAATDAKRDARHAALTQRGEDLMMMSPEELLTLKLDDWLARKAKHDAGVEAKAGRQSKRSRYIAPVEATPSGDKAERFKAIAKTVKTKV